MKRKVLAAAMARAPPVATAPPPSMAIRTHMAWLDQRLRDELEQLTSEEVIEVLDPLLFA